MIHRNSDEVVNALVTENIRLAYHFAKKNEWISGYNDALSIAMEGLLEAAQSWQEGDIRFGTWASVRIRWRFSRYFNRDRAKKRGGVQVGGKMHAMEHIPLDAEVHEGSGSVHEIVADNGAIRPGEEMSAKDDRTRAGEQVQALLRMLSPRDRQIIELRFGLGGGEPMILHDIGVRFKLTRERVRQIEASALRRFSQAQYRLRLRAVA